MLDIGIIILIALSGWSSFRGGFTRSIWGLVAISSGVFAASRFWRNLAPILQKWIKSEEFAKWISVILIAAIVSMIVDWLFEKMQSIVEKGVLGWINGVVGAVFGVAVSCVLIGTVMLLLSKFGGETIDHAINGSTLAPALINIAHEFFDFGKQVVKDQAEKL